MFISKKELNRLQREVKQLNKSVCAQHKRIWDLENPPKFDIREHVKAVNTDSHAPRSEARGTIIKTFVQEGCFSLYREYEILEDDSDRISVWPENDIKRLS